MAEERESDERFGIQSVEVAGAVLKALTLAGHSLPLRDIARATGLQAGKVHRYLVSLSRIGLVAQERGSGHYGIGMGAVQLGLAGLRNVSAVKVCADLLVRLRDETGETALLSLWTPSGPVVVQLEESARPVFMNVRVGSILPLMRTATGRQFAAQLDDKDVRRLLQAEIDAGVAPHDSAALLADVRVSGIATVRGTLVPAVVAVAGPVFNHNGVVSAVIGIVGSADEVSTERMPAAIASVKAAAAEASSRLGHLASTP